MNIIIIIILFFSAGFFAFGSFFRFSHKNTENVNENRDNREKAEDWTAAEELALADHTRSRGLGAWEDIADLVRACHTPSLIDRPSPSTYCLV